MYCTIWWWLTRTETCELYQADMIINFAGMTSCRLVDIYLCVGGSCCLDSYSEHGGNKFYRNVCDYLPLGMASHSKRPVWYFQTSRDKHWFLWDGDCSKSVYIREMSTVLGTLFFQFYVLYVRSDMISQQHDHIISQEFCTVVAISAWPCDQKSVPSTAEMKNVCCCISVPHSF